MPAYTSKQSIPLGWEKIYDVIATLRGSEFPDEWIIRGNHYDAWVNGAEDPISGQVALLEEARAFGEAVEKRMESEKNNRLLCMGWEEEGLLGSTEWVEDHARELKQKAVVYINSDGNGRGFLGVAGSHSLESFVNDIARDVQDPETKLSVWKRLQLKKISQAAPEERQELEGTAEMENRRTRLGIGLYCLSGFSWCCIIEYRIWRRGW